MDRSQPPILSARQPDAACLELADAAHLSTRDSADQMTREAVRPTIEGKLAELPDSPGVYLMRAGDDRVLYVGKARSLRSRVRSYFRRGDHSYKTRSLVSRIVDFNVIVTDSEVEALVLENNLIKEHRPRFNVTYRDDKQYLYLKVTVQETYPRVATTRIIARDGSLYFGPYTSAKSLRQTLKLLNRLFPYRTCNISMAKPIPRPCLKYDIGLCNAPCTRYVTVDQYREVVDGAVRFLRGEYEQVKEQLTDQMWAAADTQDYEEAARFRDRISAMEKVVAEQKVSDPDARERQVDVIAAARQDRDAMATVFRIRGGKLIGHHHYDLTVTGEETEAEMLDDFVREYYDRAAEVPQLVLVPQDLTDVEVLESWLKSLRGANVTVRRPQRGPKRRLVQMAVRNAAETLHLERTTWLNSERKRRQALLEIGVALDLPRLPRRIECYDISHIQGSLAVGSLVVFEDGVAKNGKYRRFKVRSGAGNDDFESLREVLRRRLRRYAEETNVAAAAGQDPRALASVPLAGFNPDDQLPEVSEPAVGSSKEWGVTPDLMLIDGGKGQLSAALEVFKELGLDRARIPLAAIAKRREELYFPNQSGPVLMPLDGPGLHLVQQIRDEAHRFAVSFHIKLRTARGRRSILDEIPGIGPKRKRNLLRTFGSLKRIRAATLEDLVAVDGMTTASAKALKEAL